MNEPTSAVEQAIAARIAKVRAEGERRRQERAEFAAARRRGLAARHAAKIRNLAGSQQDPATVGQQPTTAPDRGETPTVADSPENMRMATKTATPVVQLVCPACRALRRAKPVGVATIARRRREVVECGEPSCGLQWIAARDHIATPAAA